jgi:hypothetical protein
MERPSSTGGWSKALISTMRLMIIGCNNGREFAFEWPSRKNILVTKSLVPRHPFDGSGEKKAHLHVPVSNSKSQVEMKYGQ